MPKAIIITIDQLSARYLSPYGNTWNPTPAFDNLAAIGMTAEYCLSSSTCFESSMRSVLTGQHAISTEARPTLMQQLTERGQSSLLIQEGDSLTNISGCQEFTEIKTIPAAISTAIADSLELTATAQFISLVMKELEQGLTHDLTWIHHSNLGVVWDAPLAYREQFFGEEDPEVANIAQPPIGPLVNDSDPDEIMQVVHAYAAQASVLDTCLGFLLDQIQSLAQNLRETTLLIVTSPRSQALGHHGGVGHEHSQPATDQLHVPLFVTKFIPQSSEVPKVAPFRNSELLQSECVNSTLEEWMTGQWHEQDPRSHRSLLQQLESPSEDITPLAQQFTLSKFANERLGILAPAWFSVTTEEGNLRLYAKPDDRWESNEIGSRRKDIIQAFEMLFKSPADLLAQGVILPDSLQKQH